MQGIETVRPTIRLEKQFNKELRKLLIDKDMTFQELAENLLIQWYDENK